MRAPGELVALATELFNEGKTNAEVIIALRLTFEQADDFRQRWFDATQGELVISPIAKKAFEAAVGPFKDVTDLVALVTTKLASKTSV